MGASTPTLPYNSPPMLMSVINVLWWHHCDITCTVPISKLMCIMLNKWRTVHHSLPFLSCLDSVGGLFGDVPHVGTAEALCDRAWRLFAPSRRADELQHQRHRSQPAQREVSGSVQRWTVGGADPDKCCMFLFSQFPVPFIILLAFSMSTVDQQ